MKKQHEIILWVAVSAASFMLSVCLVVGMIIAIHLGTLKGEESLFVRYVISIALGISTATLTVGGLKAKAAITGRKLGIHIDLGGAAAVLALTVFGAFYFTTDNSFDQTFYLKESITDRYLSAESMSIVLNLDTGPKTEIVGPGGFIAFKDLPAKLKNTEQTIATNSPSFKLPEEFSRVKLDGQTKEIKVNRKDEVMWSFRRKVNYEIIKLLVPLRLMAGESFGEHPELPVSVYKLPEVIQSILSVPLNHNPGNLSLEDFRKMYVYLPDEPFWKQEWLDARGTFGERLAKTAMDFVDFYQNLSQLERTYMSERELTLIHELRSTLMVERMKNLIGIKLDDDETLIKIELEEYIDKIEALENEIGPFEMLFVTF
jgi:hypothetical protein